MTSKLFTLYLLCSLLVGDAAAIHTQSGSTLLREFFGSQAMGKGALMVLFIAPGECDKCVGLVDQGFDCLNSGIEKKGTLGIVAAVHVLRTSEVHLFQRNYGWKHDAVLDSSDMARRLGLDLDTRVAVFSRRTGKLLGVIRSDEMDGSVCGRLKQLIGNVE